MTLREQHQQLHLDLQPAVPTPAPPPPTLLVPVTSTPATAGCTPRRRPGEWQQLVVDHLADTLEAWWAGTLGDDCVTIPNARTANRASKRIGTVTINGSERSVYVHCLLIRDGLTTPPPGEEATHRCGNPACTHPGHLRWAPRSENVADQFRLGEFRPRNTHRSTILQLLADNPTISPTDVALVVGCSYYTALTYVRGVAGRGRQRRLTPAERAAIAHDPRDATEVAAEWGIEHSSVRKLRRQHGTSRPIGRPKKDRSR